MDTSALTFCTVRVAVADVARPSTGTEELVKVPFPSSPVPLSPQHVTPPPVVRAHVCCCPVAICTTPLVRPETSTGMVEMQHVPLPSSPTAPSPQHFTLPPVVRAQVWLAPTPTEAA